MCIPVNTHVHADHVTGSGEMKKRVPGCKSMIAEVSKARADVKLRSGDSVKFGPFELEVRSTPGHTNGMLSVSIISDLFFPHSVCLSVSLSLSHSPHLSLSLPPPLSRFFLPCVLVSSMCLSLSLSISRSFCIVCLSVLDCLHLFLPVSVDLFVYLPFFDCVL